MRVLWAQRVTLGLVGVLYTFSMAALQAILSVSTIALTVSYMIPIITVRVVGRDKLLPGSVRLGGWALLIN